MVTWVVQFAVPRFKQGFQCVKFFKRAKRLRLPATSRPICFQQSPFQNLHSHSGKQRLTNLNVKTFHRYRENFARLRD